MKRLRWFYVPNEAVEGDQVGPRRAFEAMHREGSFSAYTAYSYLVERTKVGGHGESLQCLHAAVEAFQPDVIYVQHLNRSYPVDREDLRRLKSVASRPKLVCHDADMYGRLVKPLDAVMKVAFAESDMAVIVGLGHLAAQVRRAGARRVLFAPHSYDAQRFGQPWQPTLTRRHDAVMIANLTCLKGVPFLFMPGGRRRQSTARIFARAYGDRFAVFGAGKGWDREPYAAGPIAFDQQERTIRSAWLSVNWGQFDDIPYYASDRLPISLAAGVPHITNHQPGYEQLYAGSRGLFWAQHPEEALDVADHLLSLPREELIEIGRQGAAYACERLNADRVYRDIVTALREQLFAS